MPPLKILVAEGNRINQKLIELLLKRKNHQVTIAENGKEAVTLFEQEKFDLILMDMQMPEMNGKEATKEIRMREQDEREHIPIIAFTANAMKSDREECLAAGMNK